MEYDFLTSRPPLNKAAFLLVTLFKKDENYEKMGFDCHFKYFVC